MDIKDFNLDEVKSFQDLKKQMQNAGFQATHFSDGIALIEKAKQEKATFFLGFTANMMASGLRGIFIKMASKKFMDAVVTTAGSLDHDVIKDSMPYEQGSFFDDDVELHKQAINRIGNIHVKTKGFEVFEEKMQKWFKELYKQKKIVSGVEFTKFIGNKLSEKSFFRQCADKNIPVFIPGITDGAVGLQLYFFKQGHPDFIIDVTADLKPLGEIVLNAEKTAALVLGGGITKHHIIGANILREGLDYAVYVSTAVEYDGSLSGARTHEAKSWGKIKENASSTTIAGEATLILPLLALVLKEKQLL